ncbi:N-acetyltransferase [Parvibaculum sp.]|jgi:predicted N-acetyltransferase YhbS|uniref:GNAT family N-acetyltransferase n=1 Tax=Parvibaculum sp. TaxID=2024848 RepID=UPI000C4AE918|nr:N-acetyltransferase [Parvibaculum sp.]MAM94323.1 GNAT family N-acetyltransferase [Parvibaculum sp.]HCX66067.1 GNAT family N-acetyltransferase [Rhodobiaceae bacterium]|tara:strand:+ start:61475 stop:61981 length:507 start_codon:yes stop_codon:yes gene_type:complete
MFEIEAERPEHGPAIEALLDHSFGPGRYAKTAQRLREGNRPVPELCYVAFSGAGEKRRMVGALSFWPVIIGGVPGLMLGPLAVDPELRGKGCGIALMEKGLADAKKLGYRLVILVGDAPYYARVGFGPVPHGRLTMPGPVDPSRLLYRELDIGAFGSAKGAITKPPSQ